MKASEWEASHRSLSAGKFDRVAAVRAGSTLLTRRISTPVALTSVAHDAEHDRVAHVAPVLVGLVANRQRGFCEALSGGAEAFSATEGAAWICPRWFPTAVDRLPAAAASIQQGDRS